MFFKCSLVFFLFVISCVSARIHSLQIKNDTRQFIRLSNFAFNQAGTLHIKISNFTSNPYKEYYFFGLTFDRIPNDGLNSYLNSDPHRCVILEKILKEKIFYDENPPIIYFPFDLRNKKIKLQCSESMNDFQITKPFNSLNVTKNQNEQNNSCSQIELPMNYVLNNKSNYYNIEFTINMKTIQNISKYNVFFHNCENYNFQDNVVVDFKVEVEEKNGANFLSITESNLPKLYCIFALIYFSTAAYWIFVLWKRKIAVSKIHILMAIVIYLKFLTILLSYINYKYIEKFGVEATVWSNLYYIFSFFKIILFFTTIILIASGLKIIKIKLRNKVKITLFLVILLQITANISRYYMHKNDEDDVEYKKLRELFLVSDFLSCILTVLPAFWTIKQLKRNAELVEDDDQLTLFKKHFVLLIIFLYFTKIIPYLVKLTLVDYPEYEWLSKLFREITYYICFTLIGFLFRPIIDSYLTAISDDVNDIDSSLPIKDNFKKFNEHWHSSTDLITVMDDEEEASLLSNIKQQQL